MDQRLVTTRREVRLLEYGSLLGSRLLGMKVRAALEAKLDEPGDGRVVVDAQGIESMSHSFADECFGKLVEQRGLPVVMRAVEFRNVPPAVTAGLRYVVGARSTRGAG